jgi:hypothetical protein
VPDEGTVAVSIILVVTSVYVPVVSDPYRMEEEAKGFDTRRNSPQLLFLSLLFEDLALPLLYPSICTQNTHR